MNQKKVDRYFENLKVTELPKKPVLPKKVYGACAGGAGSCFIPQIKLKRKANASI